jgi:hypothetical protein
MGTSTPWSFPKIDFPDKGGRAMALFDDNHRIQLVAVGAGLVAALLLAAWLFGYFERDENLSADPHVAELQRAIQDPGKADIKFLKQKYAELSPEQQHDFNMRKMLMSMPQQEHKLRDFFNLPEAEQWKQIDREIDAGVAKRRQAGAGMKKQAGAGAGVQGIGLSKASGRPSANPRQIMAMKKEWTANASPELRSMMDRRLRMMKERREQRGL